MRPALRPEPGQGPALSNRITPLTGAVALGLAGLLVLGVATLRGEAEVAAYERLEATPPAARDGARAAALLARPSAELPARAAMLRALVLARDARLAPDAATRTRLLDTAAADARRATALRSASGPAWLARSFVATARGGMGSGEAIAAYARSYAANRYLAPAADWRLQFAVQNWDRLSPATRAAVADEGRWFGMLGANNRVHVYTLTGGTPVYQAISGDGKPPPLFRPNRQ